MRPPAPKMQKKSLELDSDLRDSARKPGPNVGGVTMSLDELREMQVWLAKQRAAKAAAQQAKAAPKPHAKVEDLPALKGDPPEAPLVVAAEAPQQPEAAEPAESEPDPPQQTTALVKAIVKTTREVDEAELMRRDSAGP